MKLVWSMSSKCFGEIREKAEKEQASVTTGLQSFVFFTPAERRNPLSRNQKREIVSWLQGREPTSSGFTASAADST